MIALINKNEINTMIIALIRKIKEFLEIKCRSNLKDETIEKIPVETKRDLLKINIFEIKNNARSYLIMKKQ